jgi:sulfite dehydrogenase (quinone) subunit SoeA
MAVRPSRRTFLKTTGAAGGALLVSRFAPGVGWPGLQSTAADAAPADVEEWKATACWIGKQDCGMLARTVNGRVVKLEGDPKHPRNRGKLCPKGIAQIADLYDPRRLSTPLIRTSAKGQPGQWRAASWDEALDLLVARFKEAGAKDPRLTAMVSGRGGKVSPIYETAFPQAIGIPYVYTRRGNDCGGGAQDATLAMWGERNVFVPDVRHCDYLIAYWGLTTSGGPGGSCWVTWPQEVLDAKERGMKVVAITPYGRTGAPHADEWLPVRPGTDMALWLAINHVLLAEGYVDEPFLKAHTNACSLVSDDGSVLRDDDGADLVWDLATGTAQPYGPDVDPATEGRYVTDAGSARPALALFREHVADYTPEWAAEVCGLPAEQIRRVALELGRRARIGSTTVIDGVQVPYRPVAFGLHGTAAKFHSSVQTNRAILTAFMLLGAVEAAGGPMVWSRRFGDARAQHARWVEAAKKDVPDRLDLGGTKWFPMGSSGYHMVPVVAIEPERYELPYRPEDMAVLVHFVNPVITSRPTDQVIAGWSRFGFVAVVDPYLSATASYCADVVLPCSALDKWEGPLGARTLYDTGDTLRQPLMAAFGESRSEIDIYTEIAERMGALYGEKGFVDRLNGTLALKEDHRLPIDRKPAPEDILAAWAQSKHGLELDQITQDGIVTRPIAIGKAYLSGAEKPYGGARAQLYIDAFREIAGEMRSRGVPESLWGQYTPYPTWTAQPMESSPPRYDLYLMDFKRIEHKHSRTVDNALLGELFDGNPLVMNTATAAARGLADGDTVWVESHDAMTGKTRRVSTLLATSRLVRPDTVALTHHVSDPNEPNVNSLLLYGDGYWDIGGSWFSHIKVQVWK